MDNHDQAVFVGSCQRRDDGRRGPRRHRRILFPRQVLMLQVLLLLLLSVTVSLPVTTANAVSIQNPPEEEKAAYLAEAERLYQELLGYVDTTNKNFEEIIDTFQARRQID